MLWFYLKEEINRALGENFGHKLDAMKSAYAEVLVRTVFYMK